MSKSKLPATGAGYLGEVMVHRLSHAVGIVEVVTEAKAGWPPQLTLKLADGALKKGRLSDFREPTHAERKTVSPAEAAAAPPAAAEPASATPDAPA